MQLVDDQICRTFRRYTPVGAPACRIGFLHVDDGTAASVAADSLGEYARCLSMSDVERVELAFQIALHGDGPGVVTALYKLYFLVGFPSPSRIVEPKCRFGRGVEAESRLAGRIGHLVETLLGGNIL